MTDRRQKDETFPCPSCTTPVRFTDTFCESCGLKLEKCTCPVCKTEALPGSRFCESCGSPLSPAGTPEPPSPVTGETAARSDGEAVPAVSRISGKTQPDRRAQGPPEIISKTKIYIVCAAALAVVALLILLGLTGFFSAGTIPGFGSPAGNDSTGASAALSLQPTQTLPDKTELNIQVEKSAVDGMVTVTLAGGPGIQVVKDIEVRLTRSDGQVQTGHIRPDANVLEVSLAGTKQTDRVEVFVTQFSGQRYRVMDQLLANRTRG